MHSLDHGDPLLYPGMPSHVGMLSIYGPLQVLQVLRTLPVVMQETPSIFSMTGTQLSTCQNTQAAFKN